MPNYTRPTEFTTGQLLGRANLGVLRDNDDYFWGLAHGWRAIPGNVNDPDDVLFDGWHYYQTDATELSYYVTMTSGTSVRLWYDYDGGFEQRKIVHRTTAGATHPGNVLVSDDISKHSVTEEDRPEGLYRVYAVAIGDGYCEPPYTTYTGGLSYGQATVPGDGGISSVGFFNRIRSNDLYFNDCKPINIAFSGMRASNASPCWDGYVYHHGTRLYYRINLPVGFGNGDDFVLWYDYGGANQQKLLHWTTYGPREDYVDIVTDGYSYTPGTRYRVTATNNSGIVSEVQYLFIEPQTTDVGPGMLPVEWGYTVMDEFTVGNYVYGSMPIATDRVALLRECDRHIFSALCHSAAIGRRDYAVRRPVFGSFSGDFRICHRYDTLLYRTTSAEMTWGDNTEHLDDYGDDGYETLDLRGLDLAYGQVYKISGGLQYAAEIP